MNHFRRNTRHALHAVGKERIELLRRRWILTFIEGRELVICYVGRREKNVIVIGPVPNLKMAPMKTVIHQEYDGYWRRSGYKNKKGQWRSLPIVSIDGSSIHREGLFQGHTSALKAEQEMNS